MKTAVDSNILIDLVGERTSFTAPSIAALDAARMNGALIVCSVVAAEISGHFDTAEAMSEALVRMQIVLQDFTVKDAHRAGSAFFQHRRKSSRPKERMLADFLVGAHALHNASALLTRDRGYYRTFFPKLKLLEPGE